MRELDGRRLRSRVQGREAIEQSIRRLLIRTHRFQQHRARSAADRLWASVVFDALHALLPASTTDHTAQKGDRCAGQRASGWEGSES